MDLMRGPAAEKSAQRLFRDGEVVGKWRVCNLIARGGNGEVYRVVHAHTKAEAALKILFQQDSISRKRFELESEILQKIASYTSHATRYFPHFLDSGEATDKRMPYVVIEYLHAYELPSQDRQVADFMVKMCSAITELHKNGYLHRDLKPGNIMRRDNGDPVLIDFGLATTIDAAAVTIDQRVSFSDGKFYGVGTIGSTAPEQSCGRATVRSDVYALGSLANDCFRGEPPANWGPIIRRALSPKEEFRYHDPLALAAAINAREKIGKWTLIGRCAWILGIVGSSLTLFRIVFPTLMKSDSDHDIKSAEVVRQVPLEIPAQPDVLSEPQVPYDNHSPEEPQPESNVPSPSDPEPASDASINESQELMPKPSPVMPEPLPVPVKPAQVQPPELAQTLPVPQTPDLLPEVDSGPPKPVLETLPPIPAPEKPPRDVSPIGGLEDDVLE